MSQVPSAIAGGSATRDLVFTDYVRASAEGGEPPGGPLLDVFLERLRGALAHELKRRGLWHTPPRYLGIMGVRRWSEGDALAELAQESAIFVFARLPALQAHARLKPNVEGLVFRILRNFLADRQKEHDVLGYRSYRFLGRVVEAGQASGQLSPSPREAGGYGALTFVEAPTGQSIPPAEVEQALLEWSHRWVPEHLPAAMSLGPRRQLDSAVQLAEQLVDLRKAGVRSFQFSALVATWRRQARTYWTSLLAEATSDATADRIDHVPGHAFETEEGYRDLRRCVETGIERTARPRSERRHLLELWQALLAGVENETTLPSGRALARLLDLSRRQVRKLFARLRHLIEACRGSRS